MVEKPCISILLPRLGEVSGSVEQKKEGVLWRKQRAIGNRKISVFTCCSTCFHYLFHLFSLSFPLDCVIFA